jgi:hypothetical protein
VRSGWGSPPGPDCREGGSAPVRHRESDSAGRSRPNRDEGRQIVGGPTVPRILECSSSSVGVAMCRTVAFLVASLVLVPFASASQPGQPLGPDDWVFDEPGLHGTRSAEIEVGYRDGMNPGQVYDNQGRLLTIRVVPLSYERCGGMRSFELRRTELVAWNGSGAAVVLGRIDDRCGAVPDTADRYGADAARSGVVFDPVSGTLSWVAETACDACPAGYDSHHWDSVRGFTTLLDVFDSFSSETQSVGFRRPWRPEGLRDADRFDTYWGNVTRPLDLSAARPLQCAYPGHWPQPGEYLSYPDAAPTPAPGKAVYYLTSVTYQGETRAGRTASAGRLVARDAHRLPECALRGGGYPAPSHDGTTAPAEAVLATGN